MTKENAARVLDALTVMYPNARAELNFSDPFETVIATILAAQCTDVRVNIVTEVLFAKYPDAKVMSRASLDEIEDIIKTCGLYHSKAKNILATCKELCERYDGVVPSDMDKLTELPGVGRKTANVVLSNAFGRPAMAVDTHVFRVSNRIGLAHANTPEKVEMQLCAILEKSRWSHAHHLIIWHGRRMCHARQPECGHCPGRCPIAGLCNFYMESMQ